MRRAPRSAFGASASARIVNIGAIARCKRRRHGRYARPRRVHRLTEALAAEWKGKITVNAVLPSIIDTSANRASMPKADFTKWVTPQELADVILFLISDAAGRHRRVASGERAGLTLSLAIFFSTALKRMLRLPASAVPPRPRRRRCRCRKSRCRPRSRRYRPLALARRMLVIDQFAFPPAVGAGVGADVVEEGVAPRIRPSSKHMTPVLPPSTPSSIRIWIE